MDCFSFNTLLPPTLESNARTREKSGKNDAKVRGIAIRLSDFDFSGCYLSPSVGEICKKGIAVNPIDKRNYARRALRRRKNCRKNTDVKFLKNADVETCDDWDRKGFCEQFEFMRKAVEDEKEQRKVCCLFPAGSTLFLQFFLYIFFDLFNELRSEVEGLL